jgi:lipoic acid synthetase
MQTANHTPKPHWLKARIPSGSQYFKTRRDLESRGLHTICQSARCPNIDECWNNGQATFLVMGDTCSRDCGFCSVKSGIPRPLDSNEPERILEMARLMKLEYVVITSVTRDDLPDGGSRHLAGIIKRLKQAQPLLKIEVLIPDFRGDTDALDTVLEAQPDVLNHNLETVKRLYRHIDRSPENYDISLKVLQHAGKRGFLTKSGIMVGLGETDEELQELFGHLVQQGVRLLTIGQYCQPTPQSVAVTRFYSPGEFAILKEEALAQGLVDIESNPFVRSSYHAERLYQGDR